MKLHRFQPTSAGFVLGPLSGVAIPYAQARITPHLFLTAPETINLSCESSAPFGASMSVNGTLAATKVGSISFSSAPLSEQPKES